MRCSSAHGLVYQTEKQLHGDVGTTQPRGATFAMIYWQEPGLCSAHSCARRRHSCSLAIDLVYVLAQWSIAKASSWPYVLFAARRLREALASISHVAIWRVACPIRHAQVHGLQYYILARALLGAEEVASILGVP